MGYDISYHPISEQQIETWYFDLLKNPEKIEEVSAVHQLEDFYKTKYQDTLNAGRETDKNDYFVKTHGFFIAVVQGFFEKYFYVRGGALSFSKNDHLSGYYKQWNEFVQHEFLTNNIENRLVENYCSGVFIPAEKVAQLLVDYHNNPTIKAELDMLFSDNRIAVFLNALQYAKDRNLGLLEATEVVEPQPFDLNESKSYSNLFNCDKEGPLLYQTTALKQIQEIEHRHGIPENEILPNVKTETIHANPKHFDTTDSSQSSKKKSFWSRLFGKD